MINAHFDGRTKINYDDWLLALENHELGLRHPIKNMSYEDKRRLAYHEAGHAVAQAKLLPKYKVHKVTIIRHGTALGLSQPKPLEEKYTQSKEELLADIQTALASRASEELFLGHAAERRDERPAAGDAARLRLPEHLGHERHARLGARAPAVGRRPGRLARRPGDRAAAARPVHQGEAADASNADFVVAVAETLLAKLELNADEIDQIIAEVEAKGDRPPIEVLPTSELPTPFAGPEVQLRPGTAAAASTTLDGFIVE